MVNFVTVYFPDNGTFSVMVSIKILKYTGCPVRK